MISLITICVILYPRWTLIHLGYTIPDILRVHYLLHTIWKVQNLQEKRKYLLQIGSFQKVEQSSSKWNTLKGNGNDFIKLQSYVSTEWHFSSKNIYWVSMPRDQRWIKFRSQEVQNLVKKQASQQIITIQCRKYRLLQQEV